MHNFKLIFAVVLFVGGVFAERCQVNVIPARACGECDSSSFAYEERPSKTTVATTNGRVLTPVVAMPPELIVVKEPATPKFTCDGKTNYEITKPTPNEQLQIDELIYQANFGSTILNFFSNAIGAVTGIVRGIFAKPVAKTLLTFHRYLLNVEVNGSDANFRIQSATKTYSHVVVGVGKVVTTTEIREAFIKSCNCGQTVYLN
ncbi:uncharacterized protein LOC119079765 [Bradysia coprophila]|uniref:uncharacterized protein LOC119079765 n=1 Tax=Bradysia coprophila TaxID=38358 RepID=UPI00187D845B|nr:uncharacterized protein LOC119079765 [Bradysia coprophila]